MKSNEKGFFSRWGDGIEAITAYQQARIAFYNTFIILIGIIAGIIVSLFFFERLWWLVVILIGALVNTLVLQIGNYQKYIILKRLENDI